MTYGAPVFESGGPNPNFAPIRRRSDDVRGCSCSPQGQAPVIRVSNKRHGLSVISTATNKGRIRWKAFEGALTSDILIDFLRRLVRDAGRKIFLILDNFGVHHSKPVKAWPADHKREIEVFYLPSYGPELSRKEKVNADLKQAATKLRSSPLEAATGEDHSPASAQCSAAAQGRGDKQQGDRERGRALHRRHDHVMVVLECDADRATPRLPCCGTARRGDLRRQASSALAYSHQRQEDLVYPGPHESRLRCGEIHDDVMPKQVDQQCCHRWLQFDGIDLASLHGAGQDGAQSAGFGLHELCSKRLGR